MTFFTDVCRSMECYVCTEQEGNDQKCLTTVRTCNQDEDTCMTDIRWGSKSFSLTPNSSQEKNGITSVKFLLIHSTY